MIVIYNDHLPTVLFDRAETQLCAHCKLHVEYVEDFGWVHVPFDHEVLGDQYNTVRTTE